MLHNYLFSLLNDTFSWLIRYIMHIVNLFFSHIRNYGTPAICQPWLYVVEHRKKHTKISMLLVLTFQRGKVDNK